MSELDATRHSLFAPVRNPHDREASSEFVEIYSPLVYQLVRRRCSRRTQPMSRKT